MRVKLPSAFNINHFHFLLLEEVTFIDTDSPGFLTHSLPARSRSRGVGFVGQDQLGTDPGW